MFWHSGERVDDSFLGFGSDLFDFKGRLKKVTYFMDGLLESSNKLGDQSTIFTHELTGVCQ